MRKLSAPQVYLILSAVMQLANAIMFTTYAVYYVTVLGLNPLQLVLVGTVLEITILLCEVPTGLMADVYGRRLSVILGMVVLGVAYIMEGAIPFFSPFLRRSAIPSFAALLLSEMIRGLGETFLSGAKEAWITDEAGRKAVGGIFLQTNQVQQVAGLAGILASVGLASIQLNLPYLVGGALYLALTVFLLAVMPENGFHSSDTCKGEHSTWRRMVGTLRDAVAAVRGRPVLVMMLAAGLFSGAASEGFDRLWEAHFLADFRFPQLGEFKPVVWFGMINIGSNLLGLVAAGITRRRLGLHAGDNRVVTRTLLLTSALGIAGMLSFGLAGNFAWALASFWAIGAVNAVRGPMLSAWLNLNIESRTRATVLSLMSQADALGQTAGGPVVGAVGARFSIRSSMVMAALLLSPALAAYMRALTKKAASSALPGAF